MDLSAHGSGTPQDRFATLVSALAAEPGVEVPTDAPGAEGRFGAAGLKVNGKIFAMLVRGHLVLKLPRGRVDALVEAGQGERFDPGRGRLMKEWLVLDDQSDLDWQHLAREALTFVAPPGR